MTRITSELILPVLTKSTQGDLTDFHESRDQQLVRHHKNITDELHILTPCKQSQHT